MTVELETVHALADYWNAEPLCTCVETARGRVRGEGAMEPTEAQRPVAAGNRQQQEQEQDDDADLDALPF